MSVSHPEHLYASLAEVEACWRTHLAVGENSNCIQSLPPPLNTFRQNSFGLGSAHQSSLGIQEGLTHLLEAQGFPLSCPCRHLLHSTQGKNPEEIGEVPLRKSVPTSLLGRGAHRTRLTGKSPWTSCQRPVTPSPRSRDLHSFFQHSGETGFP